ncbi:MAG: heat-inducible transcription repressor HrcA [Acidobacteria bacterium]|nr:heat-inducible transcription repressor HrcA [Acidobacteriota bacterium]
MDDALAPRQQSILRALVREFIRTGEPVGSKELVHRYRLDFSPATVRGEMARLEEDEYLAQPHASAGRIPTDRAYRFFVDHLPAPGRLTKEEERAVHEELSREPESLDDLLQRASEMISRITHHAAAVLAPRLAPSRLRRIDLVGIGGRAVVVVIVADGGRVEERIVRLDRDVSAGALDRVGRDLNRDLLGRRLDEAHVRVAAHIAAATEPDREVLEAVAAALREALTVGARVYVGGTATLAEEESFRRETLQHLYEVIERQQVLLDLLAGALDRPFTVRIGSELPYRAMHPCSIVAANYGIADSPAGTVGVIGPTRMNYERAIAAAGAVARTLEGTLGAIAG